MSMLKINLIAEEVRKWAEKLQRKEQRWDDDLTCMCGIASFELFKRLKKSGFSPVFVVNETQEHAFIICNKLIIDVTATQFGYDEIEIMDVDCVSDSTIWSVGDMTDNVQDIITSMILWPWDQRHPDFRDKEYTTDDYEKLSQLIERKF
jgi:hypothetical protein